MSGRADPFTALGLASRPDLTDDEVRAAWRRVAAATHPDREDGGDPQRFAVAAAAYTALRTRFGRGEAIADLAAAPASGGRPGWRLPVKLRFSGTRPRRAPRFAARIRNGRPGRLALRVLAALAASAVAVAAAGFHPAAPALVAGAATWLACTARHDLAPPG
jgi:curved DNA-binding protein CbpA